VGETVGHHTCNLCHLLLLLEPDCRKELLVAALYHDVPEGFTGDIPAPAKWESQHLTRELKELETAFYARHNIPNPELYSYERTLLKAADMLDLALSSIEELGLGNQSAAELIENAQEYIYHLDLYEEHRAIIETIVTEVRNKWVQTKSKSAEATTKDTTFNIGITLPTDLI
jgi:5'-deoxynucleotidase YfbR-like HD superfamily hydrolase